MDDHNYVYKFKNVDKPTIVHDIFLAHLEFVNLVKTFHTVLFIDSIYKTNQYKIPLFEIGGSTSTHLTYFVGFAFLTSKKEDNFT